MEIFAIFEQIPAWIVAITTFVTGATAITALTPNKHDDKITNAILKVLNILAGNIGKNTNADQNSCNHYGPRSKQPTRNYNKVK